MDLAEVEALVDLFAAAPPRFGCSVADVGGARCFRTPGVAAREFNRVHGTVRDAVAVRAYFEGEGHIVCGGGQPEGYLPGYAWMKFLRPADAEAGAPTDLVIEQVGPAGGLDFAGPVRVAFGMPEDFEGWLSQLPGRPGWTCLVAYDGEAAVGAGAMYVSGDQAWLGLGATLPEARGRGAQSAILAARVALAAQQGADHVVTETGVREPGRRGNSYRNILRAGFEEAGARMNWDSPTA